MLGMIGDELTSVRIQFGDSGKPLLKVLGSPPSSLPKLHRLEVTAKGRVGQAELVVYLREMLKAGYDVGVRISEILLRSGLLEGKESSFDDQVEIEGLRQSVYFFDVEFVVCNIRLGFNAIQIQ